ncbi:ZHX3 protein, partial [Atractosteus spatula]|nr:ZHX3 protein [Atractosteus spatula]
MASKRKSTIPCMIPVKSMHIQEDLDQEGGTPDSPPGIVTDLFPPSEEAGPDPMEPCEPTRTEVGTAQRCGGPYTCQPCDFESQDLNLFLDHMNSSHPSFRAEPSFCCLECGVSTKNYEGLALHNARAHPSAVPGGSSTGITLQVSKKDRKTTVEQTVVAGEGGPEGAKESEISITKTPIMKMLKGKSEPKRIVVSHSVEEPDTGCSKEPEKRETPTVTAVATIVHNGPPSKVTLPPAIQIVNGSNALPVLKTAITQVVSVVQNRSLQQPAPISLSSTSSKNLPKVMIPLSSIPAYNAAMDTNSYLKSSFSKFPYPTKAELCYLTVVTKYPEEQIKIWFTAQRLKQGISWSPEEIEDARRKMFNTIIQTAPPHHSSHPHTITVLPAPLGSNGMPHIIQGSLVGQGGVIVTQPMMANGIQVSSAPMALAVTPKPQMAAKPQLQARPSTALVADKGASTIVSIGGSSSSSVIISSISNSNKIHSTSTSSSNSINGNNSSSVNSSSSSSSSSSTKVVDTAPTIANITHSTRTLPSSILDPSFYKNKKSQEQLTALKQSFLRSQFPEQEEVERLTKITGLTIREVRKWFSDRRYHYRNLKGTRSSAGGLFSGNSVLDLADSPSSAGSPTSPQHQHTPQQPQQQATPTTPSRRSSWHQTPDFTAIRYKERDPQQVRALEASFTQNPLPSPEEVDRLRAETKMTRREIDGWFSERRKKVAAEKKKEEEEEEEGGEEEKEEPSRGKGVQKRGKEEKQKEVSASEPKVNPIKINLKMLKVTESNGKPDAEASSPAPTESPRTLPSVSPRSKKTPEQLHLLKQLFARTQWPSNTQYEDVATQTGLPRPEVVRWFGDSRYVCKNGQLKWLESYQRMVEEEGKEDTKVLADYLASHKKLEEEHVKGLADSSGLSEEQVRQWFVKHLLLLMGPLEDKAVETGSEEGAQDQEELSKKSLSCEVETTQAHELQSSKPKERTLEAGSEGPVCQSGQ